MKPLPDSIQMLIANRASEKYPEGTHDRFPKNLGYVVGFTDCLQYMDWRDENYVLVDGDFYHKEDTEGNVRYDNAELLEIYFNTLNKGK